MRELTDHVVNPVNDRIKIFATDEPGAGGANHRYQITGFDQPPDARESGYGPNGLNVMFQNGTIPEKGVNGITQEALLAIVADRLRSFQSGPYACIENARALILVQDAIAALKSRTLARMARGVEGTHEK